MDGTGKRISAQAEDLPNCVKMFGSDAPTVERKLRGIEQA